MTAPQFFSLRHFSPRLTKQCEKETHPANLFRKYPPFPYNKKIKQKATTIRHSTFYPCGIIMPNYADDADSVNLKQEIAKQNVTARRRITIIAII